MKPNDLILVTDRLYLRTWRDEDIPLLADISSDPNVMEHFPALQSLSETRAMIKRIRDHHKQYGFSLYAAELRESAQFIGFVGLNAPSFHIKAFDNMPTPIIEIGWRLAKQHWGKGYAPEAALAVMQHAFTQCNLISLVSFTAKTNTRSIRVMEKIGMRLSCEFKHPIIDPEHRLNRHVLYQKEM